MLEIKNALFSKNKKEKININRIFENGITYLSEESDTPLFNFLIDKEKYLEEGSFIVDGISFIPYDEKANKSIFFLKIDSQNISILSSFVFDKENKKEGFINIQKRLNELKELPLTTLEEKTHKVSMILNILKEEKASFVVIDFENNLNKENSSIIKPLLNDVKDSLVIIIRELSTNHTIEDNEFFEFNDYIEIGGNSPVTEKQVTNKRSGPKTKTNLEITEELGDSYLLFNYKLKKKFSKSNFLLNFLFRNGLIIFFLILSLTGFTLTFLISPQYFSIKNTMLGVVFIALGIVFLGLFVYNTYCCYDFIPKTTSNGAYKTKFLFTSISLYVVLFASIGISLLLYYIFVSNTKDFSFEVFNIGTIITIVAGFVVGLTFPLFVKYYYRIINFLKRKLKDND